MFECGERYVCVDLFFFKRKTSYDVRISDWSSYVCSSDLFGHGNNALDGHGDGRRRVDDREFEALLPQYLKIGGEARNGSLRKGGIFRLPLIPPISERSLRINVDQNDGTRARILRLD